MDLFKIKTEAQWETLLGEVAAKTKMVAALTDVQGKILKSSGERSPLCAAIRDNEQALTFICAQTNSAMFAQLKHTLRPAIDECEAGLQRFAVPIVRDNEVVGQVTACGTAESLDEVDPFFVTTQIDLGEEEVKKLLASTETGSVEDLQAEVDRLFSLLNPPAN